MTTEDMIENIIQLSLRAYKKNSRGCREAELLDQHKEVVIDGISFSYWREYAVYKVCEYLKEKCPEAEVECFLDGNNSSISINLDNLEQRDLNTKMYSLIKKFS